MEIEKSRIQEKIQLSFPRTIPQIRVFDRPTSIQILLWVMLVIALVSVSLSNYLYSQVGSQFDEHRYLILARSLVYADHYGMMNVPGEPASERYPFGYPLLIAPIVRLFPDQLYAPKFLSLVATVINITILFWFWPWFSRNRSYWWGLAVTGLYAVSPLTIDFSRLIMSEPAFLTFSLISILLAEKVMRGTSNLWIAAWLGVSLTFVVFTRTIGVLLLACIFIYFLYMKRGEAWKIISIILFEMALLVAIIVAFTPVQITDLLPSEYFQTDANSRPLVSILSSSNSDSTDMPTLPQAAPDQVSSSTWTQKITAIRGLLSFGLEQHFGYDIREITVPFGTAVFGKIIDRTIGNSDPWIQIYSFIVSGLLIFGLFRLAVGERFSLFIIYSILYFAALFLWTWNHPRLLYPIQPQIQMGWLTALEGIFLWVFQSKRAKVFSHSFSALGLGLITTLLLLGAAANNLKPQDSQLHTGDLRLRTEWVKAHTQPSDIIMTERPEVDYLYGERKTLPYPVSISSDEVLQTYLEENHINYILVAPDMHWEDNFSLKYSDLVNTFLPFIDKLKVKGKVTLIYSSDADLIQVYRVVDRKAPPEGQ